MALSLVNDLDALTAGLHGRRSRLAEAHRLDERCRLRTVAELGATVFPGEPFDVAADLQRRCVTALAGELGELAARLRGAEAGFLCWLLVRFQIENVKVALRGLLAGTPAPVLRGHLLELQLPQAIRGDDLLAARSPEELAVLLSDDEVRAMFEAALSSPASDRSPFLLEASLDRGYFAGLLARLCRLGPEDRDLLAPLVRQEVDAFHIALAARGRFLHRFPPDALLACHVAGSAIPRGLFEILLADSDLSTVALRCVGRVIDGIPGVSPDANALPSGGSLAAALETLAWHRFLRLANGVFRRSHMGFAAVVGYMGVRRIEVANLITLSEGIRLGLPADRIRARLVPRPDREVARV